MYASLLVWCFNKISSFVVYWNAYFMFTHVWELSKYLLTLVPHKYYLLQGYQPWSNAYSHVIPVTEFLSIFFAPAEILTHNLLGQCIGYCDSTSEGSCIFINLFPLWNLRFGSIKGCYYLHSTLHRSELLGVNKK